MIKNTVVQPGTRI